MSEETVEEQPKFKLNRKQRIKLFHLKRSLGYLPVKPEARIIGSHEYIRMENVNDPYVKITEHKFQDGKLGKTCEECKWLVEYGAEDFSHCKVEEIPSQLDLKLTELKSNGRKVLNVQREWGGWTIKMMAP